MKIVFIYISIIFFALIIQSCQDSLGLDANMQKQRIKILPIDYSEYIPKIIVGDTAHFQVFSIKESGEINFGDYVMVGWLAYADSTEWCDKKCVFMHLPGDNGPWCYGYTYIEGTQLFTAPSMEHNRKTWSPDLFNMKFPDLNNIWLLRADFDNKVKSWISLDSFQIDYPMGNNMYFSGKRFIWGERSNDTTLIIFDTNMKCLKVIEYFNFKGDIKRMDMATDTSIDYTYTVESYYGEKNIGMVVYIEKHPSYNLGLGETGFRGWRSEITGKKFK